MIDGLYLPLVFSTAIVGFSVASFSLYNRHQRGAIPLALFALVGSLWAISEALIAARSGLQSLEFWMQVSLSVSAFLPVAWILLALEYSGRGTDRWFTPRNVALLLFEPILFVLLVWTTFGSGQVWVMGEVMTVGSFDTFVAEFGIAFWGHQVYASLLFTAGAVLVARMLLRSSDRERWLGTVLLAAIALPIASNAAYIYGIVPPGVNPTGMASVLTATILTGVLLPAELHRMAPITREIGREAVLEELDDAIVILDADGHVIDLNPEGSTLLQVEKSDCLGRPLAEFRPELAQTVADGADRAEIELDCDGSVRHFDVRISPLELGYGTFSGAVVSLRNVTDRLERKQRLDVLNRLLRHNIRNQLNLARGEIELAQAKLDGETDEPEQAVHDRLETSIAAVDDIVDTSNKVGRLSRLIELENQRDIDIAGELRIHRENGRFDSSSGAVRIALPETLSVSGGESLISAFEELILNGLNHNDHESPQVTISLDEDRCSENHVVIDVRDNGPGIDELEWRPIVEGRETPMQHTSGVGLWLANWVIRRAGGRVTFDNDEDGSVVHVQLPRGEVPEELSAGDD